MDDKRRSLRRFFIDLIRRRVVRFTGLYAVGTVLLLEMMDILTQALALPSWAVRAAAAVALAAFPLAAGIVWVFDWTPEGVRRTDPMRPDEEERYAPGPAAAVGLRLGSLSLISLGLGSLVWYVGGEPRLPLSAAPPPPLPATVAVLPFRSGAGDAGAEVAPALHERLIEELGGSEAIAVTSRSQMLTYETTSPDPRSVGRELGVAAVALGDVVEEDGRAVVSVRLLDVETGDLLWRGRYEIATGGDVLPVARAMATAVTTSLLTSR